MRAEDIRSSTARVLEGSGFTYSEVTSGQSFDFVARREDVLLLVRTLGPRAEIDRSIAGDLRSLSKVLKASPLLVVPSGRMTRFHDGVLYLRFGVPMVTLGTLADHLLEGMPPMIFFGPGGHYVSLDGDRLKSHRESSGLSLGALSEMVGVSRRAIQMYEGGMGADLDVAIKLEKALNVQLIRPLDPFSRSEGLDSIRDQFETVDGLKKDVFQHLDSLGLEIIPTIACPFDALARSTDSLLLTSVESDPRALLGRGSALSKISQITGGSSVIVVRDGIQKKSVCGTPVIKVSELRRTDGKEKLFRLIEEREG